MTDAFLFKRLVRDLMPAKKYLISGLILYAPVTILTVIQPIIIGYAIQNGVLSGSVSRITTFVVFFFSAVALQAFLELTQGWCLQLTGQMLVAHLRQQAFEKMQRLSMGFLDSTPLGRPLTRLSNDAESVGEMFSLGAVQMLGDCLFLVGTFVMLLFVDVKLTFYSGPVVPLLIIGFYFFRRWTKKAYTQVREALSNLNTFLHEYLSGISTVQMSHYLDNAQDGFLIENKKYYDENRQAIVFDAAIYSFIDALSYLAAALVLWGAFHLQFEHVLSLGVLVAFLEALSRFFQPIRELSSRYAIFQSALVSLGRIYDLFSWPEEIDVDNSPEASFLRSVTFDHVWFSYKNDEPVLKDVSFTFNKNERIALVGPTGAGKSTVAKLLNRFYPVNAGAIFLDNQNINELSLRALRRMISVVPQEVFLFQGTLYDNLTFGRSGATDEELWQALDLVQMADVIKKKGGLKAPVSTRGQNFSLGERQLIAMARTLLCDPPILILDEATASIDAVTEQRLQLAIKQLLKKRTALIIAHRLSTILDADRILVFHGGRIVEEGNHQTLIERNGMYASLIHLQELKG